MRNWNRRAKALKFGIKPENIFIDDLREEFVRDFVFPMFRANTVYEGEYLLGTSIARPLIAKRLIEIAKQTGADAISHGATGKGNDQVRFELGAYALMPDVKVIAPWREWDLLSREKLLAYAEEARHPGRNETQAGRLALLDGCQPAAHLLRRPPSGRPRCRGRRRHVALDGVAGSAPDAAEYLDIEFEHGDIVALNGTKMSPAQVLTKLNELGGKHGIGRLDLVEKPLRRHEVARLLRNPGGTIMLKAHRAIESITLDREVAHLKDDLMPRYASMIYNGYWWSPERLALQTLIDQTQKNVNGWVRVKLYKGNVIVVGRDSKSDSLFDSTVATFEDDRGAYDQKDAAGFIKLNALRMRIAANLQNKKKQTGEIVIHELSGDILLSGAKAIAQGVAPNDDFHQGLALQLRERMPAMYKDFRHYCQTRHPKSGGVWSWMSADGRYIVNLFTQDAAYDQGSKPGQAKLNHLNHACMPCADSRRKKSGQSRTAATGLRDDRPGLE